MALIVPLVAARNRTPSSTAAVSFAERLAGTVSGPQRLHGQACASGAARRVAARAVSTRTSREGPAALRFILLVRAFRGRRGIGIATRRCRTGQGVLALSDCGGGSVRDATTRPA